MTDAKTIRRIVRMRERNRLSLREIAESVGLSREWVRQILIAQGVLLKQEPNCVQERKNKLSLSEEVVRQRYGCTLEVLNSIQGNRLMPDRMSPVVVYRMQRNRALRQKRGWAISLPEWWAIWKDHWPKRIKKNLVMVALDKRNPISPDNARIITRSEVMEVWHDR